MLSNTKIPKTAIPCGARRPMITESEERDNDLREWARTNSFILKTYLDFGLNNLIKDAPEVSIDLETYSVITYDISAEVCYIEDGVIGWDILVGQVIYNYPHEPDDYETTSFSKAKTNLEAARTMIDIYWNNISNNYWTNIATYETLMDENL